MLFGTDSLTSQGEVDDDVLRDLRALFPSLFSAVLAAEDDDGDADDDESDDTDEDADDESEEDDEDSEEDEDDDEEDSSKGRKRGPKDPKIRRLQDENARRRVAEKKARNENRELKERLKKLEDKGKPDDKKVADRLKELETTNAKLSSELAKYKLTEAVGELARDHKVADTGLLEYLLHKEGVELDEDGEWPDDVAATVKRLKKKNPSLVAKGNGRDDDDESDDDGDESSGKPSVKSTGKGRRRTEKVDKQALAKKFPALAGRV